MRFVALALAAAVALPLSAATRYAIDIETSGDALQPRHRRATVLVDGANRRIDVEQPSAPFTYDVLLSSDGGATFTALNTARKTWFQPNVVAIVRHPHIAGGKEATDIRVTTSEEPSESKSVVRVAYTTHERFGDTKVDAQHGETILIWTTNAVDPALAVRAISLITGIADVDAQLAPAITRIAGFPMKTMISATRAYAGGRPQTITVTATVSDIRGADAPAHAFERPSDYVHEEPFLGGAKPIIR